MITNERENLKGNKKRKVDNTKNRGGRYYLFIIIGPNSFFFPLNLILPFLFLAIVIAIKFDFKIDFFC